MNKAREAFSLLELFMSIALIMLMSCMIIPKIVVTRDQVLIQALDRIEVLFHSLQQRALACGCDVELMCDISEHSYTYKTLQGTEQTTLLGSDIHFGVVPGTMGPPWQATEVVTAPITFRGYKGNISTRASVMFYSNGKISPGTMYLCDKRKAVGGALTCAVSQVFYIRKYLYNGKQWKLINSQ